MQSYFLCSVLCDGKSRASATFYYQKLPTNLPYHSVISADILGTVVFFIGPKQPQCHYNVVHEWRNNSRLFEL